MNTEDAIMRYTDEPAVKELAEIIKGLPEGTVFVLDTGRYSIRPPAWYDLPEEDPDAEKGDPLHWMTTDDAREKAEIKSHPEADMPHELLSALALALGFQAEGC